MLQTKLNASGGSGAGRNGQLGASGGNGEDSLRKKQEESIRRRQEMDAIKTMTQDRKAELNWIVKGTGADEASLVGLIESLLKEERNAVLSEVEREVEKQTLKSISSHDVEIGFNYAKEIFSTIITNLRVGGEQPLGNKARGYGGIINC